MLNLIFQGKKLWGLNLNKPISCLCLINLPHLSTTLVGVGLREGPFQLYQGKRLVDFIPTGDTVSAARFGHLGQEENVLVIVTQSKIIFIAKIDILLLFPLTQTKVHSYFKFCSKKIDLFVNVLKTYQVALL